MPESDARSVECPFSGVTKSGRVWRKVPESDARSVECPFSGVTKSGRVWRKVPESDFRRVLSNKTIHPATDDTPSSTSLLLTSPGL